MKTRIHLAVFVVLAVALTFGMAFGGAGTQKASIKTTTDSLAVGARDTSAVFNIKGWKDITAAVQYDGDSAKISIQTSWNGALWQTLVSSVQCNGAPGTNAVQYQKSLVNLGAAGSAYYTTPVGLLLRFILYNDDSASKICNRAYYAVGE